VPPDLHHFVEDSLRALAHEAPAFYARLCATLQGRRLRLESEGQPFTLHFRTGTTTTMPSDGSEDLHMAVSRRTILALVDGELTIEDAVRQDALFLRGSLTHVADLFEGLFIYLSGGVRCPSFPQLLGEFRIGTQPMHHEVRR
jgi:hypothetical protein